MALGVSALMWPLLSGRGARRLYAEALSGVGRHHVAQCERHLGAQRSAPTRRGLDYLRAVPTGPLCPLVLAVTTRAGRAARRHRVPHGRVRPRAGGRRGRRLAARHRPVAQRSRRHDARPSQALILQRCAIRRVARASAARRAPRADAARARAVGLRAHGAQPNRYRARMAVDPQVAARILALDPENVSDDDVRTVLAAGPTPRIVALHGGIYPVHLLMDSFSRFLAGMGYPQDKLRHPGDGRRSHSPYESSTQIAGLIAWYYEREGADADDGRPQPGRNPAGEGAARTGRRRRRADPGLESDDRRRRGSRDDRRPVHRRGTPRRRAEGRLRVGGRRRRGRACCCPTSGAWQAVARRYPIRSRSSPATRSALDLVAWDLPGAGIEVPGEGCGAGCATSSCRSNYSHVFVAATSHLARDPAMREWINAYAPGRAAELPADAKSTENSLWAADVWYSIKKHWVLEAQKLLRARHSRAAAK